MANKRPIMTLPPPEKNVSATQAPLRDKYGQEVDVAALNNADDHADANGRKSKHSINPRKLKQVRLLGRGAVSTVYLMQDPDNNSLQVAQKSVSVAHRSASSEMTFVESCLKLRKTVLLKHIVKPLKATLLDHVLVIYMEYLDRGTLRNVLDRGRRRLLDTELPPLAVPDGKTPQLYPEDVFVAVALQCLFALQEFMKLGCTASGDGLTDEQISHIKTRTFAHRDIKPSNVLCNKQGAIKLGDFGSLGVGSQLVTKVGATLRYMAPERFSELPYCPKVDIWSLGITLWELACGSYPYRGLCRDPLFDDGSDSSGHEVNCLPVQDEFKCSDARRCLPDGMSAEAKDFLASMLEPDPKKRASLSDALRAPLIASHYGAMPAESSAEWPAWSAAADARAMQITSRWIRHLDGYQVLDEYDGERVALPSWQCRPPSEALPYCSGSAEASPLMPALSSASEDSFLHPPSVSSIATPTAMS